MARLAFDQPSQPRTSVTNFFEPLSVLGITVSYGELCKGAIGKVFINEQ